MRRPDRAPLEGARPTRRWRNLYWGVVATVIAVVVGGLAFGYLNTSGSGTGSASTGGVSLAVNAPATTTCNYSNLSPGDLTGSATCALSVTYTGSLSGWVSLTVKIQSTAGTGGTRLYDGTNTTGLTFAIKDDGNTSFTVPTTSGGMSCGAGCWQASNDLAAWYSPAHLMFSNGKSATWTVTPKFLASVGNAYEGGSATLTLTAQAVQSDANPLPASCTTSTIGAPCAATWS